MRPSVRTRHRSVLVSVGLAGTASGALDTAARSMAAPKPRTKPPSLLQMLRAGVQIGAFLIGAELGGLTGAIIGQMIAGWVLHLFIIRIAIKHRVWDPLHDAIFAIFGALITFVGMSHMLMTG